MANEETNYNPLTGICKDKFIEDLTGGNNVRLAPEDFDKYWLGFCRGISHACDLHSSGITKVQEKFKELEQNHFRKL